MTNQSIITKTMFLDANGHRLKIWFIWDQINCVLRVIRVREVIGPDGLVKEIGSDGDDDGSGDVDACKVGVKRDVGEHGHGGAGGVGAA